MTYKDKESCGRCPPCITQVFCSGMGDTECLNLQVSFRKTATTYRALLLEMTYRNTASYASSPPCTRLGHLPQNHIPQKSPMINDSVAERNVQLKECYASLPLCMMQLVCSSLSSSRHYPPTLPTFLLSSRFVSANLKRH